MCSHKDRLSHCKSKFFLYDHLSTTYNSLLGNAVINKNVVVLENHNIILRRDYKSIKGKVKIIGGGGAGVEPSESCYVGKGMLTAAVLGEIFTAPSANEILIAIRELATEASDEILLLVKNYLGDKLNFGLALDRASSENINVKMLLIGDNAAEIKPNRQGNKGLAGSVLVYKIAGEMAEQGKTLEEIIDECRENILTDLVTVSAILGPSSYSLCKSLVCHFEPNEVILGAGIYGCQGMKKIKINNMTDVVSAVLNEISYKLKSNFDIGPSNVIVLVNNLGATSKLEESLIVNEVTKQMNDLGFKIVQFYAGTFMSSLNTQGFSITTLKVNSMDTVKCLIAPTSAPSWPKCTSDYVSLESFPLTTSPVCSHDQLNKTRLEKISIGPVISEKAVAALKQIIIFASEALISCEKQLNIIDSEVGDGDAGIMLKKGAEAIKKAVLNNEIEMDKPCKFLFQLSEICCSKMGGLSGALYTVFFSSAAKVFQNSACVTLPLCFSAFKSAVKAIQHYGKAELGDRTMLDALYPAVETFESCLSNGKNLVQTMYLVAATCEYKAEQTKFLKPLWLRDNDLNRSLVYADAGAHGVAIWLRAVSEGLRLNYPSEC